MCRWGREGSISMELLLTFPILAVLMWSGTIFAYASYSKAALQMTAMRAARELAADSAINRMHSGDYYQYNDFTESYGLPRPKVQMIVGRAGNFIVAGACYRFPLPPIWGKQREEVVAPDVKESINQLTDGEYDGLMKEVEGLVGDGKALAGDVKELAKHFGDVVNGLKEFKGSGKLLRYDAGNTFSSPAQFDQTLKAHCKKGPGFTLASRSTFWSEPIDQRPKSPSPAPATTKVAGRPMNPPTNQSPAATPEQSRQQPQRTVSVWAWPQFIADPDFTPMTIQVSVNPPAGGISCKVQKLWPSFTNFADVGTFTTDASGQINDTGKMKSPLRTRVDPEPVTVQVKVDCGNGIPPATTQFQVQRVRPLPARE